MNKIFWIALTILVALNVVSLFQQMQEQQAQQEQLGQREQELIVRPFSIQLYRLALEDPNFHSELDFGVIIDGPEVAIYYAERAWETVDTFNPRRPYRVYFDEEEDVWLIMDTLPHYMVGGNLYVFITKQGKVISMFGTA